MHLPLYLVCAASYTSLHTADKASASEIPYREAQPNTRHQSAAGAPLEAECNRVLQLVCRLVTVQLTVRHGHTLQLDAGAGVGGGRVVGGRGGGGARGPFVAFAAR